MDPGDFRRQTHLPVNESAMADPVHPKRPHHRLVIDAVARIEGA